MADRIVFLTPDVAARGAADLAAAGSSLSALRGSLGDELARAASSRPWGADEPGAAFARVWCPAEQELLAVWASLGQALAGLGDGVRVAVASTVEVDAAAARRVGAP